MAVLELERTTQGRGAELRVTGWASRIWRRLAARHEARLLAIRLARMSPYQLRDMGFDPEAVYDAVEGTWDEVCDQMFRYWVR